MIANLRIFCERRKLEEYFKVVDAEDTAIAYLAALAGGKQLDVSPTSVKGIAKRDNIMEVYY